MMKGAKTRSCAVGKGQPAGTVPLAPKAIDGFCMMAIGSLFAIIFILTRPQSD
jgi:hypothetical protein